MLQIGEIINDRYCIEEYLGEGGMAIVYLGRDLLLERYVAIKEIKSSLSDYTKYIERLAREAKTLAHLNHPNIVTLHDFEPYHDNWYLIMEYVEGTTLEKKLELDGALSYGKAIPIFKQMMAALDHAHQAGIIHRDMKPGNVMIKSDSQVKVMDFGLAKDQTNLNPSRSTRSGGISGTLYYLSPEQVESDGKVVDLRSDIYSLGLTCYEVLAGSIPVKDKKTTVAILNAILRDNFPPPTKFNSTVPKSLSQIVRKAIALDPNKRFQSAGEMLEAIQKFEEPPSARPRGIRFTFEILWKVALVALVAVLILFTDWDSRLLESLDLFQPTRLKIVTEPEGARVILNGKPIKGRTPLEKQRANADTNYVQIQLPDYEDTTAVVVLQKGQDSTLTIHLKPLVRPAVLAVVVKPPEAEIMFDGKVTTPSELSVKTFTVGEHTFVITLEGYKTLDSTVFLAQGLNTISFELEKFTILPREGRLTLTSEPSGAEVEIRGPMAFKRQTPIMNLRVPAGKYEFAVHYEKYQDTLLTATIDSGRTFSRHVELAPQPGLLKLTINPQSAVYINQRLVHELTDSFERKLAHGTYHLKILHSATAAFWTDSITIASASEFGKEFDFSREFKIGITAVDTASNVPLSAEIIVDGVDVQKSTPDQILLRFGHHEIEVRAEGYESQSEKLNVESTTESLKFRLKRVP